MGPESTGTSAREPRPLLARCARGGVQTHVPPQCTPLARCCSFARYRPGPFRCLRLLSRKVGQNRTRASGEKQDSPRTASRFIALAFSGNNTPNARTPPLTSPGFRSLRIAPEVAAGVLPVRSRGCGRRARACPRSKPAAARLARTARPQTELAQGPPQQSSRANGLASSQRGARSTSCAGLSDWSMSRLVTPAK